jgi:hypothetical protein
MGSAFATMLPAVHRLCSRGAGHRQLLRLLLRLRPAEHAAHFDLLGAAAAASPSLAAAYLAAAPGAEPRPGLHWQAAAAALGRCITAATAGQAPLLLRAQRRAPVRQPQPCIVTPYVT